MLFSIVTPSFNQGDYLAETIESVIGQEGDFFIDYLIMDGGSTDKSVELIKHYEKLLVDGHFPLKCNGATLRWTSEKDKGQTDALKKGFAQAKGAIFSWLNSDDVYLPGALQTVKSFFQENQATSLLYGQAYYADAHGEVIGRYPTEEFSFDKLAYFNFFCQPSTFFRRTAFAAIGGLDETLNYAMDYDLFVRIARQFPCCYLPQFFSRYRLHETSKTVNNKDLFENHEEALRLAMQHFGWAPLNRVYGSCYYYSLASMPQFLTKLRLPVIASSLFCTIFRSLRLNRGLRRKDLKLLRLANFKKMFKGRMEILHG